MKTAQSNVFDLSSVPVETLVKTICLWVRCDAEACSTKEVHEGMPKIRLKLLSLVRGDRRWNTEA